MALSSKSFSSRKHTFEESSSIKTSPSKVPNHKTSPVLKFIKKRVQEESSSPTHKVLSPTTSPRNYIYTNKGKPPIILRKKLLKYVNFNKTLKTCSSEPSIISKSNDCSLEETMENYEIGPIIGQGSFSTVHKAIQKSTGRLVAIKTYDKSKNNYKKCVVLQKEKEIMQKISHTNIVKFIESIESPQEFHLIMEFIPGISLYGYLKQHVNTRIEEASAKKIFSQLVSAVDYLHSNNISHCDLKLENILITHSETIKIIDFGFSEYLNQKKKVFSGSFYYMSPEIVSLEEYYGGPADIWALGIILFTILTGAFPFKAIENSDLYKKIRSVQVNVPAFVAPEAARLINKMLKKECQSRPKIREILSEHWLISQGKKNEDEAECKLSLSSSLIKNNCKRNDSRRKSGVFSRNNSWRNDIFKILKRQ